MKLKTGGNEADLLGLPWHVPLDQWPEEDLVLVPTGSHRHVVRFVDLDGTRVALKELPDRLAWREYDILEAMREEGMPAVTLIGVTSDRVDEAGEPLEAVLMTRHLSYSLPYRTLFGSPAEGDLWKRLVDALAVLLVRLHLAGFFWGDCSLNNALFRRDAGALRAYVVDTETAERHESLSDGQRRIELDIAAENVAGGLLDLQAEGLLRDDVDPTETSDQLVRRYEALWAELTDPEELPSTELGRIHQRLHRLNDLGFDTEEYELSKGDGLVRFRPTVVEEGHHKRVLERLTGIVAHENQARRLLAALRGYGAWLAQIEGEQVPDDVAALRWMVERWRPTLERIPDDLRARLEDPEIFHQVLEHGWLLSERRGGEVPIEEAADDYVAHILAHSRDERWVIPTE